MFGDPKSPNAERRNHRDIIASSSTGGSDMWQLIDQLDASIAESAKREAQSSRYKRRGDDVPEAEEGCKLPLRLLQESTGAPIGFEVTRSVSWSVIDERRNKLP